VPWNKAGPPFFSLSGVIEALGVPIENFAGIFAMGLPGGGFRLIAFISSYFMAFLLGELLSC
jgi:hypothetical protein